MVFKSADALRTVTEGFGWIMQIIQLQGLLKLLDNHVQAQRFFRRVLNSIYCLELTLMDEIQANYPAIDLGDFKKRVAYQVTAEKASDKVQHTLNQFIKYKLHEKFDELTILILGQRQATYKSLAVPPELKFDCDRHITDIPELIKYVGTLGTSRLEELAMIIKEELITGTAEQKQQGMDQELLPEASDILIAACEPGAEQQGRIVLTFNSEGWLLRCGDKGAQIPHTERATQARAKKIIEQLLERKLIQDTGMKSGHGGNLIGWYTVRHEGYLLSEELLQQRKATAKAGSVNLCGDVSAGSGKDGPGGNVIAQGGAGRHGASGGDVNAGPGNLKAGDGGMGPGGDIIIRGGDAE